MPHAPGHIRDAFIDLVESEEIWGDADEVTIAVGDNPCSRSLRWIVGQLWNCSDQLPGSIADVLRDGGLDFKGGSYAAAARQLHSGWDEQEATRDVVAVRRQWDDWREIDVPVSELTDFHLRYHGGGVGRGHRWPMLYARMWCSSIPAGAEFPHSCTHGNPPHEIVVCITKACNPPGLYKKLRAGARPPWSAEGRTMIGDRNAR